MARGQKRKSLTLRASSATGCRKGTKSTDSAPLDENADSTDNQAQARIFAIPRSQPKPRPKPRPIKPANVGEAGGNETAAAHALVSLQNCTNMVGPTLHCSHPALGPSTGLGASDKENFHAEEECIDELEDEVDELYDSDSITDSDTSGRSSAPQPSILTLNKLHSSPSSSHWLACSAQTPRILHFYGCSLPQRIS